MKRRFLAFVGAALACAVLWNAPLASADVNDFTVTSFKSDQTLTRKDAQGELRIVENINVDFTDNNHGILRAIPNSYKKHRLLLHINKISSKTGAPTKYSTYSQNGNTVIKIGDSNQTVTGNQEYTIDYTVRNVVTFYNDHDELYWDINGDDWAQTFDHVSVQLHLPNGLKLDRAPICYAGSFGSVQGGCSVTVNKQDNTVSAATQIPLSSRQTLSLVTGFDKGYFHPSRWYESLGEYGADISGFFAGMLLPAIPAWLLWLRKGRDPKGKGVIVPQYDAPDGLGPIEVGTLIDFSTDNKDITAAIINLAIRRYITIVEQTTKKRFGRDATSYVLRLENSGYGELDEFERKIMADLFGNAKPGTEIDMSDKKYQLSATAGVLRNTVGKSLEQRGYVRPSPISLARIIEGFMIVVIMIVAAVVFVMSDGGIGYAIGAAVGLILAVVFLAFLSSRTEKGVEAKEHISGLKLYLEVAEKDRINKLQSPDAKYAPKTKEPKRTVELFEKLLPYAMILGVEQQWAQQFEHIYRKPPEWYSGHATNFTAIYLATSLSSGVSQQIGTAFSAPGSSSGSGFGGGGAGGGGGGGGGGGW